MNKFNLFVSDLGILVGKESHESQVRVLDEVELLLYYMYLITNIIRLFILKITKKIIITKA